MPEIYPNNEPTIHTISGRHPDKNISISNSYKNTIKQEFGGGYERRIIKTRRTQRKYTLRYTKVEDAVKTEIENFYNARSGDYESFQFNLAHIHESGLILTRFQGDLNITLIDTLGDTNYYDISFTLLEVYN